MTKNNKTSDEIQHLCGDTPLGFHLLLVCLLALLVLPAFFSSGQYSFFITLLLSATLLSSLYLVAYSRREWLLGSLFIIPALLTNWWADLLPNQLQTLINDGLYVAFLGYVSLHIFRYLFEKDEVTLDMVCAALCLYLLIGLIWAFIYHLIEIFQPGSFDLALDDAPTLSNRDLTGEFSYYSYVTLSTLGYGDITPLSRLARAWSTLEAVIGQFYMAVVLARIVGLYINTRRTTTK